MKKFLALVLALVMTMSLVTISAGAEDFTDDASITYEEAVEVMAAIGVVGGYADGSFNPTAGLTRGAAAKIICNMLLGPTTAEALVANEAPFSDVAVDNVFAGYIAYCVNEGIISGYADGTFKPAAPLTGYAFMKMLLGALGYDPAVEGYTGANWSIQVAKRALAIGLDEGLVGDFKGTKALTREEACLYAFNTLNTCMVKYDNNSTIKVGDIVVTTNSQAEKVTDDNAVGAAIGSGTEHLFREEFFTKLSVTPNGNNTDNFGRPTATWFYKDKKVGTYDNKTPVLTYTATVKEKDIFADLGAEGISGGSKYVVMDKIYVDGVLNSTAAGYKADHSVAGAGDTIAYYAAASGAGDCAESVVIAKGDKTDTFGSGEGVLVEIYKTDVANHYEMVVIKEYLTKVNSITKADVNADKDRAINTAMGSFETEEFAKGDYVIVTKSAGVLKSAVAAEKVEDVQVTAYKDNDYVIADGVTYKYSQTAPVKNTEFKMTADDSYSFYLDTYGNIIAVEEYSVTSTDYVYVLDESQNAAGDNVTGKYLNVKYIDATGKTTVVKTYGDSNNVSTGAWYTVAEDEDHAGYHKFAAVNTEATPETVTAYALANMTNNKLAKTQPAVTSALKANAGTIFVLKVDTDSWKVYEGIAAAPSYAGTQQVTLQATGVAGKDGYADIIYIDVTGGTAENSAADDVAYILSETPAGKYYDAANKVYYNELNAIVKGEKTTVKVAVDSNRVNAVAGLTTGLVKIDTYNANGYISKVSPLTSDGYTVLSSLNATEIAYSEPTLSIGNTALAAKDAVVYMIDANDTLTVGTVDDLVGTTTAVNTNVAYVVYASKTDSTVTAIYFDGALQ